jgi:SAM-dependent methyltransferase
VKTNGEMQDTVRITSCPVCSQAQSRLLWRTPHYELRGCGNCGLALREPPPTPRQYDGPAYFREYLKSRETFRGFFREILSLVHPFSRPPGRLLDVGCGVGLLLQTAREAGWTPVGVDISPWPVEYARSRKLEAHLGELSEDRFEPESFDVIVLNHVVEHVPDPPGARSHLQDADPAGWGHVRGSAELRQPDGADRAGTLARTAA